MDLNKLISNTNDAENATFQHQTEPLVKRNSQPRLSSIHSLMNDNAAEENTVSSPQQATERKSSIPIPIASSTESHSAPSIEQRAAPFLPTDSTGVRVDELQNQMHNSVNGDNKEPTIQPLNTTESKSSEITREEHITHNDPTALSKPPLPETSDAPTTITQPSENIDSNEIDASQEEASGNLKKSNDGNKLHEQIQKLESLKQKEEIDIVPTDGKPKRYRTKPIWAQDYIPTINRVGTSGSDGIRSIKSDLSFNSVSKLDIPSLTGSIPRNDFNKLVTEWIWANIEGVKQDYSDIPNVEEHIEVELKLGNIWDKVKDSRIQLPINTECIIATDYVNQECFFKSGITLESYNNTKTYMTKIMQEAAEQQKQGRGHASNKFVVENSHVIDLIASDSRRNDKPISGRVSLDMKTKRKTNSISKQRISDLFLHLPNTLFDLRLTMSLELPNELNDAAFEVFKKRVSLEREKERTSFIHQATSTRIDLTKIREKNNRVPKYELELEINTPALLRSMRNVMDDPLYYIDLVQAFLDNGRIITRQLSNQLK